MHQNTNYKAELRPKLTDEQAESLLSVVHNLKQDVQPGIELSATGQPLFVGTIRHGLDSKGRFAITPVFADQLRSQGSSCFMTLGTNGSLWLFDANEYRRILSDLNGALSLSPSARKLKEYFTNNSYDIALKSSEVKSQNRIQIPLDLRNCAFEERGMPNKILLCGSGNFIEIKPLYEPK